MSTAPVSDYNLTRTQAADILLCYGHSANYALDISLDAQRHSAQAQRWVLVCARGLSESAKEFLEQFQPLAK